MNLHLTQLSQDKMLLIVQVAGEVIVETVHINELTQRVLNYSSLASFSRAYVCEDDC